MKNWKQRWFVIKNGTLSYFKSPRSTSAAGIINLQDVLAINKISDPPLKVQDVQCEIELSPAHKDIVTSVLLSEENKMWTSSASGEIFLWDSNSNKAKKKLSVSGYVTQLLLIGAEVWVATRNKGEIHIFSTLAKRLGILGIEKENLTCMCSVNVEGENLQKNLQQVWVGYADGTITILQEKKKVQEIDIKTKVTKMMSVGSQVWVGTSGYACVMDVNV